MREYSSKGRLSSTSIRPDCISASSSAAAMLGVPLSCSTNSPKALLGTCTPENSTNPAFSQAGDAAIETREVGVAGLDKNFGGALDQAVVIVAEHDAGRLARHQTRKAQLEPAQRHIARP